MRSKSCVIAGKAKQSHNREAGNEKGEMGKDSYILLSPLASRLSLPEYAIASSQAPRNDKMRKS